MENITFSSSDAFFSEAYCLNPPRDSCEYGPCPNPDVTGYGQQISLYVSNFAFVVTLVHSPEDFRFAWYSYLGNALSLLLSAIPSILTNKMTQNDATFVILSVASPASLYLWFLSLFSAIRRKGLPASIAQLNTYERYLLFTFSALLFLFWVIMFPLTFLPSSAKLFSQPACNFKFSKQQMSAILWSAEFVAQISSTWFLLFFLAFKKRIKSTTMPHQLSHDDIFMWTYDSIIDQSRNTGWFLWSYPRTILILLHIFPIYFHPVTPPLSQATPYSFNFKIFRFGVKRLIDSCVACLVFAGPFIEFYVRRRLPTIIEVVLLIFIFGTAVASSTSGLSFLSTFLSIIWVCFSCLPPTASGKIWATTRRNFLPILCIFLSLASHSVLPYVDMAAHPLLPWFFLWQFQVFKPNMSMSHNVMRIWYGIMERSPIFKFILLVLTPTSAWILSTTVSNPSWTKNFSFGQIYSVLTSAVALSSLVATIIRRRRDIWRAIRYLKNPKEVSVEMEAATIERVQDTETEPPNQSGFETGEPTTLRQLRPYTSAPDVVFSNYTATHTYLTARKHSV